MNIFYTKFTSIYFISICIFFSSSLFAQDFKSLAAKAAQQKYEATLKKAKADYIKELEAALDFAVKTNNKDEIGVIADELSKLRYDEAKAETTKEDPKPKTTPGVVLSDKHNGLMGNQVVDNIYYLTLKKEAGKKTFLVISIFEVGISYGDIYLNKEPIGKWATTNESPKTIEIDITKYVVNGLKKYEIEFKYKGGNAALQVSEVKAEFR